VADVAESAGEKYLHVASSFWPHSCGAAVPVLLNDQVTLPVA
jgi:hypothetical protein